MLREDKSLHFIVRDEDSFQSPRYPLTLGSILETLITNIPNPKTLPFLDILEYAGDLLGKAHQETLAIPPQYHRALLYGSITNNGYGCSRINDANANSFLMTGIYTATDSEQLFMRPYHKIFDQNFPGIRENKSDFCASFSHNGAQEAWRTFPFL